MYMLAYSCVICINKTWAAAAAAQAAKMADAAQVAAGDAEKAALGQLKKGGKRTYAEVAGSMARRRFQQAGERRRCGNGHGYNHSSTGTGTDTGALGMEAMRLDTTGQALQRPSMLMKYNGAMEMNTTCTDGI